MGKNNKKRKRNHALFHAAKARMNGEAPEPVAAVKEQKSEKISAATSSTAELISETDLTTTLSTLQKLVSNPTDLHSKRFKELRRTLHPLVLEQLQSYDKGVDYRHKVTHALNNKNWSDALAALQACQDFQQFPKQGTVQRWVRDCMAAGNCQFQLLQAILRVNHTDSDTTVLAGDGNKHDPGQAMADHLASNSDSKDELTILEGWKWWDNDNNNSNSNSGKSGGGHNANVQDGIKKSFRQVFQWLNAPNSVTDEQIQSWSNLIYQSMMTPPRLYHNAEHVLEVLENLAEKDPPVVSRMEKGGDPISRLAILFHDVIYYSLDKNFSEAQMKLLKDVVVRDKVAGEVTLVTPPANPAVAMVCTLFGIDATITSPLIKDPGRNEFLSALVAVQSLQEVLDKPQLIQLAMAIETTIPFRGPTATERLFENGLKAMKNFAGSTYPNQSSFVEGVVAQAVNVANSDLGVFATTSGVAFLDSNWRLLPEWSPSLLGNEPTLTDLQKAFSSVLQRPMDVTRIFVSFRGTPADLASKQQQATKNLKFMREHLTIRLLTITMLAELVDAIPLSTLFAIEERVAAKIPPPCNDSSSTTNAHYNVLTKGRGTGYPWDAKTSPLAAVLFQSLEFSTETATTLLEQHKQMSVDEWLKKLPANVISGAVEELHGVPSGGKKTGTQREGDGKKESVAKLQSSVLYREAAAERTPPNHYDLLLHTTEPGSIVWSSTPPPTATHPVPFLPQPARVISNVLTLEECHQIRETMTALGYRPDHPVSQSKPTGIDSCEWMVEDEIANKVLDRVQPHLPEILHLPNSKTVKLHSLNHRWRGFRYGPECVYRPHLDGSWPACYIAEDGTYACPKQSAVKSYLTFLIYLNDEFEGGETLFYLPQGVARGVVPKTGSVIVFPQGNLASLIHEGSEVTSGNKYVVRTDVLYRPVILGQTEEEEAEKNGDETMK